MEELRKKIARFLSAKTTDNELVADLTQETMLRLWSKSQEIDIENVEAWSVRVARNLLIDHFRASPKSIPDQLPEEEELNETEQAMLGCQQEFISALDQESQWIITEIDLRGVSQKDLAARLGMPYPSLRSKVQRARKKIKSHFDSRCRFQYDAAGRIVVCAYKNEQTSQSCINS